MTVQVDGSSRRDLVSIARGGIINLLAGVCYAVCGFGFAIVLARGLGATGAGAAFEVIALYIILSIVGEAGASYGAVRALPRALAAGPSRDVWRILVVAVVPVVVFSALIGVVLFLEAGTVARLISQGSSTDLVHHYLLVVALFLPVESTSMVILRSTQGLGTMIPVAVVENIGKPVARFALALLFLGLFPESDAAFAWVLPSVVGLVVAAWWLTRITLGLPPSHSRDAMTVWSTAVQFWRFALFQGLAAVLQAGILWLDVVLVGALASTEAAGIYTASSRYVAAGSVILTAVIFVVSPRISLLLALREFDRVRAVYQTASIWLLSLGLPLCMALGLFAPAMIHVFGSQFASGSTALEILAVAMLVNLASGPVMVVLLMSGRGGLVLLDNVIALAVNIVANVLLIPRLGIDGAALAWTTTILTINLLPLFQIRRMWGLQPFGPGFWSLGFVGIVSLGLLGLGVRAALGPGLLGLVVFLVAGSAVYLLAVRRFRTELQVGVLREAVRRRRGAAAGAAG